MEAFWKESKKDWVRHGNEQKAKLLIIALCWKASRHRNTSNPAKFITVTATDKHPNLCSQALRTQLMWIKKEKTCLMSSKMQWKVIKRRLIRRLRRRERRRSWLPSLLRRLCMQSIVVVETYKLFLHLKKVFKFNSLAFSRAMLSFSSRYSMIKHTIVMDGVWTMIWGLWTALCSIISSQGQLFMGLVLQCRVKDLWRRRANM